MSRFFSLILLLMLQNADAQNLNWVKTIGGASADGINCLVNWGDTTIIAGNFRGAVEWDGNTINSNGGSDLFLYWIDANGDIFQAMHIGSPNNDEVDLLKIDTNGNLYIAARFKGSITIDNQTISSNNNNYFIAKIDQNADLLWLTHTEAQGIFRLEDMQLDAAEEFLYLTGYYNDSLSWQGQHLYSNIEANACIFKLDQNAQLLWMRETEASREVKGRGIVPMPNGKLWFMAEFRDSLMVAHDTFYFNEVHTNILLAQLDTSGQWLSAKRWGGVLYDRPRFLRPSPDYETLWMVGEFVGLFEADSLQLATAYRYYDLFWVQLDSNGQALRAGQSMTNANSYVLDLLVEDEAIYLTGYFQDSLSGNDQLLYSNGAGDAFCYRLSAIDASLEETFAFGGLGNDQTRAVACRDRRLWLAGDFQNNMDLLGTAVQSEGPYDGFLANILLAPPSSQANNFPKFISVQIRPNPSPDSFEIVLAQPEGLRWQLYNLQGKHISSGKSTTVYWKDLPQGTYSLKIETDQGIAVEKVVRK